MEKVAPLRQNIGFQASMFSPTKGTAMILNHEQALLKAQAQLQDLIDSVHSAVEEHRRIDLSTRARQSLRRAAGITIPALRPVLVGW
jgi:hypothetical protein